MKTIVITRILVLAAALCIPVPADAQTLEKKAKPDTRATANAKLLEHYDSDKNGKFDAIEIENIGKDRMLMHDANKDGRVDEVELKAMQKKSKKMPPQDHLARAMAREEALQAAKLEKAAQNAKKDTEQPAKGTQ